MSYLSKIKDSNGRFACADRPLMKISLVYKPFMMKVCFSLAVFIYMIVQPSHASASFFSDIVGQVMGPQTQAAELAPITPPVIHNSQTVPLLESSINPDLKSIKDEPIAPTISPTDPGVLASSGTLDADSELEKYASDVKISTYIVKKGDTLKSISTKLKIPQSTIIASNADLKKSDLLKIGQKLVIIALKADVDKAAKADKLAKADTTSTDKTDTKTDTKTDAKKDEPIKTPVKDIAPVPGFVINTDLPSQQAPQVQIQTPVVNGTVPQVQAPADNGQPNGNINGGYIWPFAPGTGRISQGRHGDNAFDFSAPKGTPILAINSGTVLIVHPSGYNGGFGKYVVINFDDGRQAIFGHMNQTVAVEGQIVKQGDLIGYVGSTGKSTGPHVHIGFHGDLANPYLGLTVNSTSEDFHD